MYARITPYKMKAGTRAETTEMLNSLKDQIMALPGITQFINVIDDDGKGYVISLTTEAEVSDETAARVAAIWQNFGSHLEALPVRETYDVVADWSKG